MRHRLSLLLTLFAWFFATGSQWDFVQTIAWGRMFLANTATMSLSEAATATFASNAELCEICVVARDGRQQQDGQGAATDNRGTDKLTLLAQPAAYLVFAAPPSEPWQTLTQDPPSGPRVTPPTPPPRLRA